MTESVNPNNIMELMGALFSSVAEILDRPEWDGLRSSHLRLLSSIPAEGIRLTDLAQSLRMTKQGAGQLAATLVQQDLISQKPDPTDGRARIVTATPHGRRTVRRLEVELSSIEKGWAETVGTDRYTIFRNVLSQLGHEHAASLTR